MYIFDTVFMIHVGPGFVVGILGDQLEGLLQIACYDNATD